MAFHVIAIGPPVHASRIYSNPNCIMTEFDQLQKSIQKNCDLVDAENAQNYGLCVYLLKMREYYRWRNKISLTADVTNTEIHSWIADQEEYWEDIQGDDFENIIIGKQSFSPFEVEKINKLLISQELIYSGGLGYCNIPMFFLGKLEKQEERQGFSVFISSDELSRGLFGPPAFLYDKTIFIRKEALKDWIWARFEEWNYTRRDNTLKKAFSFYSFENDEKKALIDMTNQELETLILHETGEGLLGLELGGEWKKMLVDFAYTRTDPARQRQTPHCSVPGWMLQFLYKDECPYDAPFVQRTIPSGNPGEC